MNFKIILFFIVFAIPIMAASLAENLGVGYVDPDIFKPVGNVYGK